MKGIEMETVEQRILDGLKGYRDMLAASSDKQGKRLDIAIEELVAKDDRIAELEKDAILDKTNLGYAEERIAELEADQHELQRLRMWCGEFVNRIEQMGVIGIASDADLVTVFREAHTAASEGGK